jgi:hypothetical protein
MEQSISFATSVYEKGCSALYFRFDRLESILMTSRSRRSSMTSFSKMGSYSCKPEEDLAAMHQLDINWMDLPDVKQKILLHDGFAWLTCGSGLA